METEIYHEKSMSTIKLKWKTKGNMVEINTKVKSPLLDHMGDIEAVINRGFNMHTAILIKQTKDVDSQTRDKLPSKDRLDAVNREHQQNVVAIGMLGVEELLSKLRNHDWTKNDFLDELYQDNMDLDEGKLKDFTKGKWYQRHIHKEKHHPQACVHADINFFDLIEMMIDCIESGKGRFGKVDMDYFKLDPDVLERAYWNTIRWFDRRVILKEE